MSIRSLKVIKARIHSKKVSSQEELVKELEVRGFSVTQSTISRDLDELRLTKVRNHRQQEYYSLDSRFYRENMFNYEKFSSINSLRESRASSGQSKRNESSQFCQTGS